MHFERFSHLVEGEALISTLFYMTKTFLSTLQMFVGCLQNDNLYKTVAFESERCDHHSKWCCPLRELQICHGNTIVVLIFFVMRDLTKFRLNRLKSRKS